MRKKSYTKNFPIYGMLYIYFSRK